MAKQALRRARELPGPRGLPVLGNLLQIDVPRMHQQLEAWCAEFGSVYQIKLGRGPVVVVGDHETMRLKPVAPLVGLQALKETVLGDVLLPAGSVVINLMRSDSVNEQLLPQARAFRPKRWLEGEGAAAKASAPKRVSMPFGAGPRICPGRYLALLEMELAIATLLGRFDIVNVGTASGQPAAEWLSFTMMPVGLKMKLRLRT